MSALRFAAEAHQGQTMSGSNLPYLVHVVAVGYEVMAILNSSGEQDRQLHPTRTIQVALLHDTVEDTNATLAQISTRFDPAVARAVDALTKRKELPKAERMSDSLTRVLADSPEAAVVKMADRVVNLASIPPKWSAKKARSYLAEGRLIYDRLWGVNWTAGKRLAAVIERYEELCELREIGAEPLDARTSKMALDGLNEADWILAPDELKF